MARTPSPLDIAVVGVSIRCAGAESADEFLDLLSARRSSIRSVPADWPFFVRGAVGVAGAKAALLGNVDRFDAALFGVDSAAAERMDPQLRLLLEATWNAVEDAGGISPGDADVGTFAAVGHTDYGYVLGGSRPSGAFAETVARTFAFGGPAITLNGAGSSSAVALHLACRAIEGGDCATAVAAGVNLILDPARLAHAGSRSNEPAADPIALGEGVAVVVLRPWAAARARADRIYGVIKATAARQLTTSNGAGERHCRASAEASEVTAEERIDAPGGDTLGSLQASVGDLEAAGGIAALITVLLHLQRRTALPARPAGADTGAVGAEAIPRRAAVDAIGGAGAHVRLVVEEAPGSPADEPQGIERPLHVLALAAHSREALRQRAHDFATTLQRDAGVRAADFCHAANTAVRPAAWRAAILTHSREELIESLHRLAAGKSHGTTVESTAGRSSTAAVAFVLTDESYKDRAVAPELYATQPVFRAATDRIVAALDRDLRSDILSALRQGDRQPRSGAPDGPATFVLGYSLAELWRSWGIDPSILIGVGTGEITAMCLAGMLTPVDAGRLVAARDRVKAASRAMPSGAVDPEDDAMVLAVESLRDVSGDVRAGAWPVFSGTTGALVTRADVSADFLVRTVLSEPRLPDTIRCAAGHGARVFIEAGPASAVLRSAVRGFSEYDGCLALPCTRPDGQSWTALLSSLARLYVSGVDVDWRGFDACYRRTRPSLPGYPFGGGRYWIRPSANVPPAAPVVSGRAGDFDVLDTLFSSELAEPAAPSGNEAAAPSVSDGAWTDRLRHSVTSLFGEKR